MRQHHHVAVLSPAGRAVLPGEIAVLADAEHLSEAVYGEILLRLIDEREPHPSAGRSDRWCSGLRPSLTKKAVARFNMSRSCRRISFSRRSRLRTIITSCALDASGIATARSRLLLIQRISVDSPTPRSSAICRLVRPLVPTSRTASSSNSNRERRRDHRWLLEPQGNGDAVYGDNPRGRLPRNVRPPQRERSPAQSNLVAIEIADDLWSAARTETPATLPVGWNAAPASQTRNGLNTAGAKASTLLLLLVPSVIVPEETNILINTRHPDAPGIKAAKMRKWLYDPRMVQPGCRNDPKTRHSRFSKPTGRSSDV